MIPHWQLSVIDQALRPSQPPRGGLPNPAIARGIRFTKFRGGWGYNGDVMAVECVTPGGRVLSKVYDDRRCFIIQEQETLQTMVSPRMTVRPLKKLRRPGNWPGARPSFVPEDGGWGALFESTSHVSLRTETFLRFYNVWSTDVEVVRSQMALTSSSQHFGSFLPTHFRRVHKMLAACDRNVVLVASV